MKKLFYLVVALCFIQVGISKAQSSVNTDKQKKETVTSQSNTDVKQVSTGSCDSKKSANTSSTCVPSKENPTCCQKKGNTTGCSGTSSTSTTSSTISPKSNIRKQDVQKEVSSKQNLGTTPK